MTAALDNREPIDRAHLRQMTFADVVLEREVLGLFDRQAETMLERLPAAEPKARTELAHAVKGSARGIGAWRVAQTAGEVELSAADIKPLIEALIEARASIAQILRRA